MKRNDNGRDLAQVLGYHERTKHHLHSYARSLGYMDWKNQPNPFRIFQGAPVIALNRDLPVGEVRYDDSYRPTGQDPQPLGRQSISQLFFDSLALSAWKEVQGNRWSLRCNPSSGNLHPTECYLIAPAAQGFVDSPAVYHYSPLLHALEQRAQFSRDDWQNLVQGLPPESFLLALTSIHWRESWKYGERAYRYCQHDAGHAIAALAFSASALGWKICLLDSVTDDQIAQLVRIEDQTGIESEHPDCLIVVMPATASLSPDTSPNWCPSADVLERIARSPRCGEPNRLSESHHEWPIIEDVAAACVRLQAPEKSFWSRPPGSRSTPMMRPTRARRMFRQRRSAVDLDGRTNIDVYTFYRMMRRVSPSNGEVPFAALPWAPAVNLVLFVHRVQGLTPGVYVLVRDRNHRNALEEAFRDQFVWRRPASCPADVDLYLLEAIDCRQQAKSVSCDQDIAADGAFAVAMIAEFEPSLERWGPWFYRHLHWEAGAIGQVLYLEAEAAVIRATGIGCFFDDAVHDLLGIQDHQFQTIYHFTLGGPVDDPRLKTIDPYFHLDVNT